MSTLDQCHALVRCGAKTRSGKPCASYPVQGRRRCRMHGGTNPGAPKGNKNAWKHGRYSAGAAARRRRFRELVRELQEGIEQITQ
jgi:hypothetical protein